MVQIRGKYYLKYSIEFRPMKLAMLVKLYLNETYSKVRKGKYF
jgi:hypothetical protein